MIICLTPKGPHCCEVRLLPGDSNRAGCPSPVMSCITRGLPSLLCHLRSGGLLPHLFTLTSSPASKLLGGLFSAALSVLIAYTISPSLSRGTLPCDVRTFLDQASLTAITRRADDLLLPILLKNQAILNNFITLSLDRENKTLISSSEYELTRF